MRCHRLGVLLGLVAGPALAADDGRLGPVSQGSVEIRVSVAERGWLSSAPAGTGESRPWCLALSTATRGYALVSDSAFRWSNGDGQRLVPAAEPLEGLTAERGPGCTPTAAAPGIAPLANDAATILIVPE